jgi:hypothetical protein
MNAIQGEERPKYLQRVKGSISGATSVSTNHDLTNRTF